MTTEGDNAFDSEYDNRRWIVYLEGVVEQSENALNELVIDPKIERNISPLVDLM